MSERNTQKTRESLPCVLADYFNDVKLMLERKQYWPTPDYVMILLTRVIEATKQQREDMLEMQKALETFLRFMPKVLRSPWFIKADSDEVDEGLCACSQAEAALSRKGGAR